MIHMLMGFLRLCPCGTACTCHVDAGLEMNGASLLRAPLFGRFGEYERGVVAPKSQLFCLSGRTVEEGREQECKKRENSKKKKARVRARLAVLGSTRIGYFIPESASSRRHRRLRISPLPGSAGGSGSRSEPWLVLQQDRNPEARVTRSR